MVSALILAVLWRGRWLAACLVATILGWPLLVEYSVSERLFFHLAAGFGVAVLGWSVVTLWRRRDESGVLLAAWLLAFFAGSIVVFYAGSARYLLPLAPALALLVVRQPLSNRILGFGIGLNLFLGLALATAEYEYDQQYRQAAREVAELSGQSRMWTNAEWGLRHYLSRSGAEQLLREQDVPIASVVSTSALAATIPYEAAGSKREIFSRAITTGVIPIRTMGRGSNSGYSSSEFGVLPFGLGHGLIDTVSAHVIGAPEPTLSSIKMAEPKAEEHLISGFFPPPDGADWRWMGAVGVAVLKRDPGASQMELNLHIPESAPARRVEVLINDELVADETYDVTGGHTILAPLPEDLTSDARIVIRASPTHSPPGDGRDLSIVVLALGLK